MNVTIVCQVEECPNYRNREKPMRLAGHRETISAWVFECPVCLNLRAVSKFKVGGTLGQGVKEDGKRGHWAVERSVR